MARRSSTKKKRKGVSAKRRAAEHQTGFSMTSLKIPEGMSFYKPKAGNRRIEILPFDAGEGNPFADAGEPYFERTFWTHRNIGADGDTYVCPKKTAKGKCPICDYRAAQAQNPDADEDLIKQLAPKERQLWNVFDHSEPDKGVQLWEVSHHLFGKRLDTEIRNADEDDDFDMFADPEEGSTLRVTFEDKSFGGNAYVEAVSIQFKPRKKEIEEELLEAAACLDELLIIKDFDDLKEIFLQTAEDGDDKKKSKKQTSSKKKSKAEEDEDDEDEDDEDDEDEDEDDEPPKKSRASGAASKSKKGTTASRSKKKPPVEDDDDDEDEDGDGIGMEDFVVHPKFGECEVVKVSADGKKIDIEDEDGKVHKNVLIARVTLAEEDDEEEDDDVPDDEDDDEEEIDDEDEDDEDEDDEDDDEEEDEPPKKPRRRSRK